VSDVCRSCKAPIRWARMIGSGKPNPLDVDPSDQGNVVIHEDGRAEALNREQVAEARAAGATLYLSHFATCPDRQTWRDRQLTMEASP
jgi:hypothetical protein